jgi:hypothetical protein
MTVTATCLPAPHGREEPAPASAQSRSADRIGLQDGRASAAMTAIVAVCSGHSWQFRRMGRV